MKWIKTTSINVNTTARMNIVLKPHHGTPGDRNSSDRLDLTHSCPVVIRDTVLCCHPDQDVFYDVETFFVLRSDISCSKT